MAPDPNSARDPWILWGIDAHCSKLGKCLCIQIRRWWGSRDGEPERVQRIDKPTIWVSSLDSVPGDTYTCQCPSPARQISEHFVLGKWGFARNPQITEFRHPALLRLSEAKHRCSPVERCNAACGRPSHRRAIGTESSRSEAESGLSLPHFEMSTLGRLVPLGVFGGLARQHTRRRLLLFLARR